jgi:hypothetical protein
MELKEAGVATEEQRSKVRAVLLRLLREHGTSLTDSVETLVYEFGGEYGSIEVYFRIDAGFFDWCIRTSKALLNRRYQHVVDTLVAEGKIAPKPVVDFDEFSEEDEYAGETAGMFAFLTAEGMKSKLKSAIYELGLETEKVFEGFAHSALKDIVAQVGSTQPSIADEVRALSKSIANERKQFMMAQIGQFAGKPRFDKLPELYPDILKIWQSAKKIYEGNSESETWRDMVKAKYPDLSFDNDLLTRITGKLEDLPEDIQAQLTETDGDHTPSTIALEHAARICGATHYQYGVRYYHKLKGLKTELNNAE